jgi:hypothetical protein
LSQACIPYGRDELEVIKGHLQDILRLSTRRRFSGIISTDNEDNGFSRHLEIEHKAGILLEQDIFSPECLRECFQTDEWMQRAHFEIPYTVISQRGWTVLSETSFEELDVSFSSESRHLLPWQFLRRTKAESVRLGDSSIWIVPAPTPGSATLPFSTKIVLRSTRLDTDQDVDEFRRTWLSIASHVGIQVVRVQTLDVLRYFWESLRVMDDTTWTLLQVEANEFYTNNGRVSLKVFWRSLPSDLPCTFQWIYDDVNGVRRLIVRRKIPSLQSQDMDYFRIETNPLFREHPPLEPLHSALLATFLNAQTNPDRLFRLCQNYIHTQRQSRTLAARLYDSDVSLIQLRTLCIDQQASIDLLTEENNRQQLRCAHDLQESEEFHSYADNQLRGLRTQTEELTRRLGRQETQHAALEAQNSALAARNSALEARDLAMEARLAAMESRFAAMEGQRR